jgi:glutathione peroxidase-family protein
MSGAYDNFSLRDLRTGDVRELSECAGKVSLIVNVASK